ncbi:MAG: NHL repeat-containing protein [Nonlabens sp.]|uniref:NHL repeat-containing protein n=1 Tax=Nonlabens sp. TaxID=1888209 RepID=UPI003EF83AC8
MKQFIYIIAAAAAMISCTEKAAVPQDWQYEKTISLDDINPIGIAMDGNDIFLSDGDHNRVVKVDDNGRMMFEMEGFERPMHIDFGEADFQITDKVTTSMLKERALFVPEYGRDSIAVMRDNKLDYLVLKDSLDAPAAISVYENEIAIADFYPNRVLFYNGTDWISIGTEGKELGQLYYPTDVQITEDKIFVADAYNHRGQVFDKTGKGIAFIGADQKINAATGVFVNENEIFLTDFENGRILVFDLEYNLKQILETGIDKPTDVYAQDGVLYITNYRKGELVKYTLKDIIDEKV